MQTATRFTTRIKTWLLIYFAGHLAILSSENTHQALDLWEIFMVSGLLSEFLACLCSHLAYQNATDQPQTATRIRIWSWLIGIPGGILLAAGLYGYSTHIIRAGIVLMMTPLLIDTWAPQKERT